MAAERDGSLSTQSIPSILEPPNGGGSSSRGPRLPPLRLGGSLALPFRPWRMNTRVQGQAPAPAQAGRGMVSRARAGAGARPYATSA